MGRLRIVLQDAEPVPLPLYLLAPERFAAEGPRFHRFCGGTTQGPIESASDGELNPPAAHAAQRVEAATLQKVAAIRLPAWSVPRNEPATFELPPPRHRYGSGTSRIRKPARAASICISIFQP